jgi:hypothetical protein
MTIELERTQEEPFDLYEMDRDPSLDPDIANVSSVEFIMEVLDLIGSGNYHLGDM